MQLLRSISLLLTLSIICSLYPNQLLSSYVAQDMPGSAIAFDSSLLSVKETSGSTERTKIAHLSKRLRPSTLKENVKRGAKIGAIIGGIGSVIYALYVIGVGLIMSTAYGCSFFPPFGILLIILFRITAPLIIGTAIGSLTAACTTVIYSKNTLSEN